ncbi:Uncharacterised protein [Acinetobacter baumannii]|nr:Uncharacterised protein [Acinetobacter baumannii]
MPNNENLSMRLPSFLTKYFSIGKSFTSAAKVTPVSLTSNLLIGPIPFFPVFKLSKKVSGSLPIGEVTP